MTATKTAAVAKPRVLDLDSAKVNQRFLDAYTTGKLDKLSAEEQTMFVFALAEKIGLRAELGELMIYQGKPYITIDGRFRLAHSTGLLVGMSPRPSTPLERRDYGCADGDVLWVCDVFRRGSARPFRGWGHVAKTDRNPVSKTFPREMAKKRAKYDALRMGFPIAETIGPLHQQYIEEAEAEIRRFAGLGSHPLAEPEYVEGIEESPAALAEGEAPETGVTAGVTVGVTAAGVTSGVTAEPTAPAPTEAQADLLEEDRRLIEAEERNEKRRRNAIREGR